MTTEEPKSNQSTGQSQDPLLGKIISLIIDKLEPELYGKMPLSYSEKGKIIKEFITSEIRAEKIKMMEELLNSSYVQYASKAVRIAIRYKISLLQEEGKEKPC